MAEQKVIAVVGATGAQGGGLVRAIAADPGGGFVARAITRDPSSDAAKALGEEVRYNDVDPDMYRGFGFPGADEMGNMFQWKRDFEAEYVGARDLEVARSLDPELKDFDAWLADNAALIPIS